MKIGSKIHPRDGKARNVTCHGTLYAFKPETDTRQKVHFVADVQNEKHAEVFLSNSAYYAYKDEPSLKRPPAPKKPANSVVPPPAGDQNDELTPELRTQAEELLKGSLADIGKAVGNAKLSAIRAAIAVENGNQNPRQNVLKLLADTLEFAKAAGAQE
jgi:hypothetical protein